MASVPRYEVDQLLVSMLFSPSATSIAQGCVIVRAFMAGR